MFFRLCAGVNGLATAALIVELVTTLSRGWWVGEDVLILLVLPLLVVGGGFVASLHHRSPRRARVIGALTLIPSLFVFYVLAALLLTRPGSWH